MSTLKRTYSVVRNHLERWNSYHRLVESYEDVVGIEALRNRYRPKRVRLLILAESHLRSRPGSLPGFIYDANYNGPWWHQMFRPAFAVNKPHHLNAKVRGSCLERLRESGVWVLDASIIALSGYRKLDGKPPQRPFENERLCILETSWHGHVKALFDGAMSQRKKPVIVCFNSVRHLIPCPLQGKIYQTSFPGWGQKYNATPLKEAAKKAGLEGCLHDIIA